MTMLPMQCSWTIGTILLEIVISEHRFVLPREASSESTPSQNRWPKIRKRSAQGCTPRVLSPTVVILHKRVLLRGNMRVFKGFMD